MRRQTCFGMALWLASTALPAAPLSQVTLNDGRQVQLNDDFTWEYLVTQAAPQMAVQQGATTPAIAPATSVLTAQAKANPSLLWQANRDGVSVKFVSMQQGDPLLLSFTVSNQSQQSVVGIRGYVSLFNRQGELLSRESVRFWLAENRLPETYLRKGQERLARVLSMTKPAGFDSQELVRVEIEEVIFR